MAEPRVCIFGCKHTTAFLIEALAEHVHVAGVVTISPEAGQKAQVADYCDLRPLCAARNIKYYVARRYSLKDAEDVAAIGALGGQAGLAMGWQRLIPPEVLGLFPLGVYGMHGSAEELPRGRGRSPMNWSLIERRQQFRTNLIRYDAGVDSGDIVDSLVFSIQPTDTAETLHFKNLLAMKRLVLRNLEGLRAGRLSLRPQRSVPPTYYPKRTPEDSIIDWRRDIFQIEAHIRAVTRPFNGAFTFCNGQRVTIYRAAIFETDLVDYGYGERAYGEVVEVFPNGKFLVRCCGGLLIVHEYETEAALRPGAVLVSPPEKIRTFPLNPFGYHDLEQP